MAAATSARVSRAAASVAEDRLVPPGRAASVSRDRLFETLDAGVEGSLTLVTAPAGSGKTVLLSEWAGRSHRRRRTAWLTVEPGDNSRRRFWTAMIAALAQVVGDDGELGGMRVSPRGPTDSFVTVFVNTARRLRRPIVLVLDDAHLLTSAEVLEDLDAIVEHAPPGLRLVLATRVDPPLRLHRLRVAGELVELRMDDLAFTLDEARTLFDGEGVALDEHLLRSLWAKTEGWPVGLRLAALSLRGCSDAAAFVDAFAGDNRSIVDYLRDEVIDGLPEATADFLLRTAGLGRVSVPLADAVVGTSDATKMLEELVRRNLLVTPTDGERQSFRYHPLFAEALLLLQRHRLGEDETVELKRRAARWHAEHGDPLEAMRHATAARDWRLVWTTLVAHWLRLSVVGHAADLRAIAAELPDWVVVGNAEVALAVAGLALEEGNEQEADALLEIARAQADRLPKLRRGRFDVALGVTELHRARLHGDPGQALAAARVLLAGRWDRGMTADLRAMTRASLGVAEMWAGELTRASSDLERSAAYASESDNDYALLQARGWAALTDVIGGRLVEARRKSQKTLELARQRGWEADPQAAAAHVALATVALHWNDLALARRAAVDARIALGIPGERALRAWVAIVQARVLRADGEADTALAELKAGTCQRDAQPLPAILATAADGLEARLYLTLGERDRARALLADLERDRGPLSQVSAAWVRLGLDDPVGAIGIARATAAAAETLPATAIEAWTVTALAADVIGEGENATQALEQALELAEPRGFRRPILDGGLRVRMLLTRLIRSGTQHRALAGDLLEALDGGAGNGTPATAPLAEPLSNRELVVLRYMPTSLRYAEVASELFVSVNTVKTHARHVYRKLDVDNRREAVARARALRLLAPS